MQQNIIKRGLSLALVAGLCQVLFAMAVIELAKKGQEAISYELVISTVSSEYEGRTPTASAQSF